MKALGLMVLKKKIFLCFTHCESMGANDPRGGAIFDPRPRNMICRIYVYKAPHCNAAKKTTIHCYI